MLPVSNKLILDVVPVDHVCRGMLMVAAQACVEQPQMVHQLSSGDLNPMRMDRAVTLTGLYKRQRFQDKETGNRFLNELAARMEFRPVTQESYEARSLPLLNRRAQGRRRPSGASARAGARAASPRSSTASARTSTRSSGVTTEAEKNIELFRPFIFDNHYIFRADNIRALRDRMPRRTGASCAGGRSRWTSTTTG